MLRFHFADFKLLAKYNGKDENNSGSLKAFINQRENK